MSDQESRSKNRRSRFVPNTVCQRRGNETSSQSQPSKHGDVCGRLKLHRECWQKTYVLTEKVQHPMGLLAHRMGLPPILHSIIMLENIS